MSGDIFTPFMNLNSQHLDSNFLFLIKILTERVHNYNPMREDANEVTFFLSFIRYQSRHVLPTHITQDWRTKTVKMLVKFQV